MAWEVEYTKAFGVWWEALTESQQDDIAHSVGLLAELGPALGFPHSSKVSASRHAHMRELRTQSGGKPLRTLMLSTLSARPFFWWAEIKPATLAGTRKPCRQRTECTNSTWMN